MWTYEAIRNQIKTVDDIQHQIHRVNRQVKTVKRKQMIACTFAEKLALESKIKSLKSLSHKLKMNFFVIEDELNGNG